MFRKRFPIFDSRHHRGLRPHCTCLEWRTAITVKQASPTIDRSTFDRTVFDRGSKQSVFRVSKAHPRAANQLFHFFDQLRFLCRVIEHCVQVFDSLELAIFGIHSQVTTHTSTRSINKQTITKRHTHKQHTQARGLNTNLFGVTKIIVHCLCVSQMQRSYMFSGCKRFRYSFLCLVSFNLTLGTGYSSTTRLIFSSWFLSNTWQVPSGLSNTHGNLVIPHQGTHKEDLGDCTSKFTFFVSNFVRLKSAGVVCITSDSFFSRSHVNK